MPFAQSCHRPWFSCGWTQIGTRPLQDPPFPILADPGPARWVFILLRDGPTDSAHVHTGTVVPDFRSCAHPFHKRSLSACCAPGTGEVSLMGKGWGGNGSTPRPSEMGSPRGHAQAPFPRSSARRSNYQTGLPLPRRARFEASLLGFLPRPRRNRSSPGPCVRSGRHAPGTALRTEPVSSAPVSLPGRRLGEIVIFWAGVCPVH